MYVEEQPYVVGAKEHEALGMSFPEFTITTQPPLRFSTLVGDCVTNARAALDYIVWELVCRYFDPPFDVTNANDRKITAFPIWRVSGSSAEVNRLNCLTNRKIPATAINEIKSVQPYNGGYEPLWWLHELVNTDKHRMPLLVAGYIPTAGFITAPVGSDYPLSFFALPGQPPTRKAILNFRKGDVEVYHQATIQVSLQDVAMPREPVDRTLQQVIETVANVIPRFDRFF
jgi:hypothetical protein